MLRFLSALVIAGLIGTQTPVPQPATVIRVTTRLVQVSLVAHDKKGQPVADLKKEDFTLYDKGQEQKISMFSMDTRAASAAAEPAKPLPEGFVSNRVWTAMGPESHAEALPGSVTVILLDGLNSEFHDMPATKAGLTKFLQQIQPNDRVAIYALGQKLQVLHDFTSDTAALIQTIDRYKAGFPWQLDASHATDPNTGLPQQDAFEIIFENAVNNFYKGQRIEITLAALETIGNHLSGIKGRKNVIWLSGGFPTVLGINDAALIALVSQTPSVGQTQVSPTPGIGQNLEVRVYAEQLLRTLRALSKASVALYPVDSRGMPGPMQLMPGFMTNAGRTNLGNTPLASPGPSRADSTAQNDIVESHSTMQEIAARTGGRAFMNSGDIAGAIRSAIADTDVSYTLVYSPSHKEWNGEFREIKVKVNRPDVEIRYRQGYYALPQDPSDEQSRKVALSAAASSPLLSTGLGITGNVVPPGPEADRTSAKINLLLDVKDVDFSPDEMNAWIADVDVLVVVRDSQNKTLSSALHTFHLSLEQDRYDFSQKAGFTIPMKVETPPKSALVRVVVRDIPTGVLGSLDVPLPVQ